MQKVKVYAVLNPLFLLLQVFVSYLHTSGSATMTVGEVSDRYPTLITPAGSTFAIWGLIYLSLGAFCVRHLVLAFGKNAADSQGMNEGNEELARIGPWFIINNLLAAAWVLAWTRLAIPAATLLLFAQLITLMVIHLRIRIYDRFRSAGSKWLTQLPLSVYFGWINVATIAGTAAYLVATKWNRAGMDFTPITWAQIVLLGAGILTMFVVFVRRNVAFGLVLIWALWGIMLKHQEPEFDSLRFAALVVMGIVGVACVVQLIANGLFRKQERA